MSEIKNLKKLAKRIKRAIKEDEDIILYSDTDLDGTTSLIILEETIRNLGGNISLRYFPDRSDDGYGLNKKALGFIKEFSPSLLILMDLGVSNFQEVEEAKNLDFEVLIIDHHKPLKKVPPASILVDPKQRGDNSPFKEIATCGLVFRLSSLLFGGKIPERLEESFLELVALGTLADRMPKNEYNRRLIEAGVSHLPFTYRPGLRVFSENSSEDSPMELARNIIRVLQITPIENHFTLSYILLTESGMGKSREMLKILRENMMERKEMLKKLTRELVNEAEGGDSSIVFEGGREIPLQFTGALASRLVSKFKKPAFVYGVNGKLIRGSVRNPKEVDGVEALNHCSHLLKVYGGHSQASGFSAPEDNVNKLRKCLEGYFSNYAPYN